MNAITKRKNMRLIENENEKIQKKIREAKSLYEKRSMEEDERRVDNHRSILMIKSPSLHRIDTLIKRQM